MLTSAYKRINLLFLQSISTLREVVTWRTSIKGFAKLPPYEQNAAKLNTMLMVYGGGGGSEPKLRF